MLHCAWLEPTRPPSLLQFLPSRALLHYAQQQVSVASCECHVPPLGEEKSGGGRRRKRRIFLRSISLSRARAPSSNPSPLRRYMKNVISPKPLIRYVTSSIGKSPRTELFSFTCQSRSLPRRIQPYKNLLSLRMSEADIYPLLPFGSIFLWYPLLPPLSPSPIPDSGLSPRPQARETQPTTKRPCLPACLACLARSLASRLARSFLFVCKKACGVSILDTLPHP